MSLNEALRYRPSGALSLASYRTARADILRRMDALRVQYRVRSKLAARALQYLSGAAPVDTDPYTDREYRVYSHDAIDARRALDAAEDALQDLDARAVCYGYALASYQTGYAGGGK